MHRYDQEIQSLVGIAKQDHAPFPARSEFTMCDSRKAEAAVPHVSQNAATEFSDLNNHELDLPARLVFGGRMFQCSDAELSSRLHHRWLEAQAVRHVAGP